MKLSAAFFYLGMLFPFSLVQIPAVGEIFPLLIILLSALLVLSNPRISQIEVYLYSTILMIALFGSVLLTSKISWLYIFKQYLFLFTFLFVYTCSHVKQNQLHLQQLGKGFLKIAPVMSVIVLFIFFFELFIKDVSEFGSYLGHPVAHGFLGEPKQVAGFMIAALMLEFFKDPKFSIRRMKSIHLVYLATLFLTFSVSGILNAAILLSIIIFLKSGWLVKVVMSAMTIAVGGILASMVTLATVDNLLLIKLAAPLLFLPLDGVVLTFFGESPNYLLFGLGFDAINTLPDLANKSNSFVEIYSKLEVFEELFSGQSMHFSPSILLVKILSTFGVLGVAIFVILQCRFAWKNCTEDKSKRTLTCLLPIIIIVSYPIAMLILVIANAFSYSSTGGKSEGKYNHTDFQSR